MVEYSEAEKKQILLTIDQDIAICQTWAFQHQAWALTGATKKRKVFRGTLKDGKELTDEEKVIDSLNTAENHIHRMRELLDIKKGLI